MTWVKAEFLSWCEAAILSLPPGAPLVSSEISSKCLDADGFCVSPLSRVDVERNVDVDGLVGGFGYVFILRRRRRKKSFVSMFGFVAPSAWRSRIHVHFERLDSLGFSRSRVRSAI